MADMETGRAGMVVLVLLFALAGAWGVIGLASWVMGRLFLSSPADVLAARAAVRAEIRQRCARGEW